MFHQIKRYLTQSKPAQRVAEAAIRGLMDAENAAHLASWPYPKASRVAPIELSICLVAGVQKSIFLRTVLTLLDDVPAGVEILIADLSGPARDVMRALSDFSAVRYITLPESFESAGVSWNALARAAHGAHLLFLAPSTVPSRHVAQVALSIACDASRAYPVVCGIAFDRSGVVLEAGLMEHADPCVGVDSELPLPARFEYAREASTPSRSIILMGRDVFENSGCNEQATQTALDGIARRLLATGVKMGFDPRLAVVHHDFGPRRHRHQYSTAKPKVQSLGSNQQPNEVSTASGRPDEHDRMLRILFVENRAPHPELGEGFPRSHRFLLAMDDADHRVVVYPLLEPGETVPSIYRDIPRRIPVLRGLGLGGLSRFLDDHGDTFDLIIVARPINMRLFRDAVDRTAKGAGALPPIVYDAEALSAIREIERQALSGTPLSLEDADELIAREVALANGCAVVVAVSDSERAAFERGGADRVLTLGHAIEARPTPSGFNARRDFVFVGALLAMDLPNADGLRWFVEHVWPSVRRQLGTAAPRLKIAGKVVPEVRAALCGEGVDILGQIADLDALLDQCRVFVAPTRFSAGIPLKVLEAGARGVPVVGTSRAAIELGWTPDEQLVIGDTADEFASMCVRLYEDEAMWESTRRRALEAVQTQTSPAAFRARVAEVLRAATRAHPLRDVATVGS